VSGMNFAWSGQSCGSTSRLMLHESIHDQVLADIEAQVAKINLGDPLDMNSGMGPVNSAGHYKHVMGLIEAGKQEGARVVIGGGRPTGPQFEKGYWVEPTIFADVTMDMRIAREEVFGPVLSVFKWREVDEVIEMANDLDLGLTAAVWTNDIKTAMDTARRMESGLVWINGTGRHWLGTGFAGWKNSGLGREECLEEILSYTQSKSVHIMM
jgi:betaine-aldehyde dehydrogenase